MHKQRVKKSVDSTFNEANNIMETPELKFAPGFVLLIVRSQIAIKSSSRIRNLLTATHA